MIKQNLITIITVVKNAETTIEKCINSVLNQNYKNIQYIIIDGNSKDKTKEIIDKYKSKISLIISENDRFLLCTPDSGDLHQQSVLDPRTGRFFKNPPP